MIKPDAVAAGNTGAITKMIEEAGFRIVAIKKTKLTAERAGEFYAVHSERGFYADLCAYMSSGAIVPMILEKENAVTDFRKLITITYNFYAYYLPLVPRQSRYRNGGVLYLDISR